MLDNVIRSHSNYLMKSKWGLLSIDPETLKINSMPVWMVFGNVCINSFVKKNLIAGVTAILTRFHVLVSHMDSHIFLLFDAAPAQKASKAEGTLPHFGCHQSFQVFI